MMDCASIIFPITPPVEFVATIRIGFRWSCWAVIRMQASEQGVGCSVRAREEDTEPPEIRVPAAESQLMVNRAASGLALIGATGGMRCTRLCKAGMSQTGSESVPVNGEPSSVEANLMPEKRLLRYF